VNIEFAVGDPRIANGRTTWRLHRPQVRHIVVGGHNGRCADTLDVPSLRDLRTYLDLPVAQWPQVEFTVAIEPTPLRARRDEIVRFKFVVANVGFRDAERAAVQIMISCCDNRERRFDWFPRIPARGTVVADVSMRLTDGRAVAAINVMPGPTRIDFRESNPDDNSTAIWVHSVSDPPLPPTPR